MSNSQGIVDPYKSAPANRSGGIVNPYQQPNPESAENTGRGVIGVARDLGVSVGVGTGALVETAGNIYGVATGDYDNAATRTGAQLREGFNELKTPQLKAMEDARQAKVDAAEGEWAKLGTMIWETVKSPTLWSALLAEQAPMLIPGAGVGRVTGAVGGSIVARNVAQEALERGATQEVADRAARIYGNRAADATGMAGAVGTGAAMHGASTGASAYDELLQRPNELWAQNEDLLRLTADGLSFEDAKVALTERYARNAAGQAGAVSILTNMIPGAAILERRLAGGRLTGSTAGNVVRGFAGETLQEATEEGTGVIATNRAVGNVDPSREWQEGVGEAAGMGALAGPFGAVAALTNPSAEQSGRTDAPAAIPVPRPAQPGQGRTSTAQDLLAFAVTRKAELERLPRLTPAQAAELDHLDTAGQDAAALATRYNVTLTQPTPAANPAAPVTAPAVTPAAPVTAPMATAAITTAPATAQSTQPVNPAAPQAIVTAPAPAIASTSIPDPQAAIQTQPAQPPSAAVDPADVRQQFDEAGNRFAKFMTDTATQAPAIEPAPALQRDAPAQNPRIEALGKYRQEYEQAEERLSMNDMIGAIEKANEVIVEHATESFENGVAPFYRSSSGGMYFSVTPSTREPGKFQITTYDDTGALSDTVVNSLKDIPKEVKGVFADPVAPEEAEQIMTRLSAAEEDYRRRRAEYDARMTQPSAPQEEPIQAAPAAIGVTAQDQAEINRINQQAETEKKRRARRRINPDNDSLVQASIKLGGLKNEWKMDVTGDTKGNKNIPGIGALFSDNSGTSIDDLAMKLHEYGYIPDSEMDNLGGVPWLSERLKDELSGRKTTYSLSSSKALDQMLAERDELYAAERERLESMREAEYASILEEFGPEAAELSRQQDESLENTLNELEAEADNYDQQIRQRESTIEAGFSEALSPTESTARDEQLRQNDNQEDRESSRVDQSPQTETGTDRPELTLPVQTEEQRAKSEADKTDAELEAGREKAKADQDAKAKRDADLDRARADATVDSFDLGKSAKEQLSGVDDMFSSSARSSVDAAAAQAATTAAKESGLSSEPRLVDLPADRSAAVETDSIDDGHVEISIAGQTDTVNVSPSSAQKEAGVYKKGHIRIKGLDISIENPEGSTRSGTDQDGKRWENTMAHHYGYIKRTKGADGEHVDVFIGPNPDSDKVFIIDQKNPDNTFDEHKVMIGFDSEKDAVAGYKANYSKGWEVGPVSELTMDAFKDWLANGDNAKPYSNKILAQKSSPAKPKKQATPKTAAAPQEAVSGPEKIKKPGYGESNKLVSKERAEELRQKLRDKLKNQLNSGIDPEMLAMGAELAAYHIEAGARKFADFAAAIADDLGVRPADLKRYLRSWYNGARDMMEDSSIDVTGMDSPEKVREQLEAVTGDKSNVERPATNETANSDTGQQRAEADPVDGRRGQSGSATDETGARTSQAERGSGAAVDNRGASADRKPSNKPVRTEKSRLQNDAAGDTDDSRSLPGGTDGLFTDRETDEAVSAVAAKAPSAKPVIPLTAPKTVTTANLAEIKAQMPFLTEGQAADVAFAENRLSKPNGFGVLFTNGTGTGKTFTGLGIIKRSDMAGKGDILIVAPKQPIVDAWSKAGKSFFGLTINKLENTKDAGKGIVVTTYANVADNEALLSREWDMIVADESHYLSSAGDGKDTRALKRLQELTLKSNTASGRIYGQNSELAARMKALYAEAEAHRKSDMQERWYLADDVSAKADKIRAQLSEMVDAEKERIAKVPDADKPRAVFLSATPFAYEKSVQWANEFLFDWGNGADSSSYNSGNDYERFMMTHFGYRMRYNKLTEPDAKVDRGLMQRAFNSWLKKEGSLSGRALDSDFDYDRLFVYADNQIGKRVDDAIDWLRERSGGEKEVAGMETVNDQLIGENFDYHARMYFLEAIKAREAIPQIRAHLKLGRKVLVMHDFKKGGVTNPFRLKGSPEAAEVISAYKMFAAEFKDLIDAFEYIPSPINLLTQTFPQALVYNGDVPAKKRIELQNRFNSDEAGSPMIMIAQGDAMREGVSIHDTSGKHPRVMIHLGMPTKPTAAIQQEGRIFRTGQASDAMFRYLTIGSNWERFAFASRIATRASAAENLAMGEQARGLKDAFISAYENADTFAPGFDGEGKGGKGRDLAYASALTPWDTAKSYYFGSKKYQSGRSAKDREHSEFFATPEPLGLKMVQWADIRSGESVLEPSAGLGAIARWFPDNTENRAIEFSNSLSSRLALHFDGDLMTGDFMDHHIVNKYDAIVMNPPFGAGGKQAADHVAKALKHLRNHGRVVALIPTGPAADKQFDKLLNDNPETADIIEIADIALPRVTFERAGTSVSARVIVLEKQTDPDVRPNMIRVRRDYSGAETIEEFFDRIEDSELSPRTIPEPVAETSPAAPAASMAAPVSGGFETWEAQHTLTGETTYMTKLSDRIEKDEFRNLSQIAKQNGGYWSRFGKAGFLFKSDENRSKFIAAASDQSPAFSRNASRKSSIPLDRATTLINSIAGRFQNAPDVIVVQSMQDQRVPEVVRKEDAKQRSKGASGEPGGAYYQGTAYIILDGAGSKGRETDAQALFRVFAHEVLGHAGLRGLFRGDLNSVLNDVAIRRLDHVKRKAKQYGLDFSNHKERLIAAEEVLAEIAQTNPENSLVAKAIEAIRQSLRKMFNLLPRSVQDAFGNSAFVDWVTDMSYAEIIDRFIVPAREFIRSGNTAESGDMVPSFVRSGAMSWYRSDLQQNIGKIRQMANKQGMIGKDQAKQWIDAATKKGMFKADEVEWTGLKEWLDLAGDKVSADDIQAFVDANGVQVEDVVLDDVYRPYPENSWMEPNSEEVDTWENWQAELSRIAEEEGEDISDMQAELVDVSGRSMQTESEAKYNDYQLPGGENYREVLLKLPDPSWMYAGRKDAPSRSAEEKVFHSSHWDQLNVLAHIRMNDRLDADGSKVLFIEEIQSDWAQEGRKNGFRSAKKMTSDQYEEFVSTLKDKYAALSIRSRQQWTDIFMKGAGVTDQEVKTYFDNQSSGSINKGAPIAPFVGNTKAWTSLALKRIIAMAAEGGYDKVAFINGEQSAKRYDLSKKVREISWIPYSGRGAKKLVVVEPMVGNVIELPINESGVVVGRAGTQFDGDSIDEILGKEIGQRIMNERAGELTGDGLIVGGDGMRAFYDQIIPSTLKDLAKKLGGGQIESVSLDVQGRAERNEGLDTVYEYTGPEPTPKQIHEASGRADSVSISRQLRDIAKAVESGTPVSVAVLEYGSIAAAEAIGGQLAPVRQVLSAQPGITITDAMREKVDQGLPLFSRSAAQPSLQSQAGAFTFVGDRVAGFSAPAETLTAQSIRKIQDKFKVLKDLQANIIAEGGTITEESNPYLAEEAFHGKAENDLRQMREQYIEPLAKKMAKFGVSRDQLDEYLYAKHAPERNAYIAKINPGMQNGSGMSDREAAQIIKRVDDIGKTGKYDQLAAMVYDMLALQREMIAEGDLESDATIDAWQEQYTNYVPLKGWAEDTKQEGKPATGSGFNIRGRETRAAMGRESKAASPVSYAIIDLTEKIIRRRKNEVGNAFLKMVRENPNPEYWNWYIDEKPDMERRIVKELDPLTGETVNRVKRVPVPMAMMPDRYFSTKRNGKTFYIKLEDERLMRAMKNLGPESNNMLIRALSSVTRLMSALNTSYAPEFVLSNFARDVQTALLNMQAEQSLPQGTGKAAGVEITAKTMKDIPIAMKAIYASLRGKKLRGAGADWQAMFDQFRNDGAKTGWFDMKDLDGQARELDNLIKIAEGGFKSGAIQFGMETAKFVENINQAVENAVRLSAYASAIKAGISRKQASSLAKNLTVNFNRRGEIGTTLNALYMFANASTQGTANFVRTMGTLKGDGRVKWKNLNNAQRIALGISAGAFFLAMANRMGAGEDDDEVNWYDKVPDYVRERNIVIMKSLLGGPEDGSYWKIPLPYGYNVFYVLGDSVESVVSGGRTGTKAAANMVLSLLGSFSPIGFQDSQTAYGSLLKNAAPTLFKPIVEVGLNENFMGSSIYSENMPFGTPKPDSALARRSTPEAYRKLASWLNEVTGGSEYRSGAIDINPDVVQHFIDYFGGSAYSFFGSKLPDYVYRSSVGAETESSRTPFISRITGRVLPYADTDQFYRRRDEINQILNEYRAITPTERLTFASVDRKKMAMNGQLKVTEDRLTMLRRQRDAIYAEDIGLAERDRRLKEVEAQMKDVIDRFNRQYNAIQ